MQYYQEGYDAYDHTNGFTSFRSCPYRIGTYSREAWLQGFKEKRSICIGNAIQNFVSSYPLKVV